MVKERPKIAALEHMTIYVKVEDVDGASVMIAGETTTN